MILEKSQFQTREGPRDVMAKVLDCGLKVTINSKQIETKRQTTHRAFVYQSSGEKKKWIKIKTELYTYDKNYFKVAIVTFLETISLSVNVWYSLFAIIVNKN